MGIPQSSYIGRHADLYDLFYADKPYREEAAFVHNCIQTYQPTSKRLLELACGTGSHALILEELGYQIIATDYSPDMLRRAVSKAHEAGSRVEFRQQDMRLLDIPERPFDVVICLFDSIGYVATTESVVGVLKNVYNHLASGGLFIFEFWHAGAMLRHYDPLRVRRWRTPDGEILRISETEVDYGRQLCRVSYSIYELRDDGSYDQLQETQTNRFFLVEEMASYLTQAGLAPLKWFSGFQDKEEITDLTWHVVAVARKM